MSKPPTTDNNSHWALGKQWFKQGSKLFFRTFFYWLIGFLVFSTTLQLLLLLGGNNPSWSSLINALVLLLSPLITVGIVNSCHQVSQQQTAKVGIKMADLIVGFQQRLVELLILGGTFVMLIVGLSWLEQLITSNLSLSKVTVGSQADAAGEPDVAAMLIKLLLSLPVFMIMVFSPQLVYFYRQTPAQALINSMKAVLNKWRAWLMFMLLVLSYMFVGVLIGQILLSLSSLAALPLLIFVLSLTAISFCGQYYAFIDTFPLSKQQSGDDDGTEIHAEM